ncbi:GPR1/FUN34/YaaH family transporter [Paenibacillus sp. HN-1]|uniref:acetate uptake transporter family protein n=1 Tax=Paenibacillus TaxID=44249 RepID=UPI001CA9DE72|nr:MULTISPECIES: GPR1/FUN34/YaaH family transporter [Paenibacillus]MBY9078351.1 GPR1/FUN34/YaaH family transporter [Paenibacillus sp. CGMCC 1.18879]MBY9083163.1 GPR1/FUN34/YaaH family transporter [Paenibacillus sinensis]
METKSHHHSWANPAPAGLVALAVSCFCFFALFTGRVTDQAAPLLGWWLLGGFVVQLVVGIVDLKNRNTAGGNTFLYFSAFFMLVGGAEQLYKFYLAGSSIVLDGHIDGWAWLCLSIALWLFTPAYFKAPFFLCLIIIILDVALPILAFMDLGVLSREFSFIPGWLLLMSGLCGIYLASAIVVNDTFEKKVYPNPGPIIKHMEGMNRQETKSVMD